MTLDDLAALLKTLVNKRVTQKTIAGNRLLFWVGENPKSDDALCLSIDPVWRREKAGLIQTISAEIPWEKEKEETEISYRGRLEKIRGLTDVINGLVIIDIAVNTLTADLSVVFENDYVLRTFTVWVEECWFFSDYKTRGCTR